MLIKVKRAPAIEAQGVKGSPLAHFLPSASLCVQRSGQKNYLVSGIKYDPEHGLGWDGDRMGNWKTWAGAGVTAAAGSIAGGIKMSGLSSSLVNGLGSSVSQGITTGDWKGSFRTGMTGAVSGYVGGLISGGISDSLGVTNNAYTTTLINNYATYGIGRLLGSGEEFDMNKIGEVDTINLVVQDMYQKYQAGKAAEAEANRGAMQKGAVKAAELADAGSAAAPVNKFPGDPFAQLDSALSGIFTSFGRGLGQTMADIGGAIKDGAVEAWGGIKTGVAAAWDGVSTVAGMAWDGVKSFGEHTSNLFTEGQYASDEEIREIKLARFKELVNNPVLVAANSRNTSAGLDAEAMAWKEAAAREREMMQLAQELGIDSATAKELTQDSINGITDKIDKVSKVKVNGKYLITKTDDLTLNHEEISQSIIDDYVEKSTKGVVTADASCRLTANIVMLKAQISKDGLNIIEGDTINIYKKAQNVDGAIDGYFRTTTKTANEFGKIISPGSDYEMVSAGDANAENIIAQLDHDNLVYAEMDDGHAEIIYGYTVKDDKLTFKVWDVGYQHDVEIYADTLRPYKYTKGKPDESHKSHQPHSVKRKVRNIAYTRKKGE